MKSLTDRIFANDKEASSEPELLPIPIHSALDDRTMVLRQKESKVVILPPL